jgi:hypothetical protein
LNRPKPLSIQTCPFLTHHYSPSSPTFNSPSLSPSPGPEPLLQSPSCPAYLPTYRSLARDVSSFILHTPYLSYMQQNQHSRHISLWGKLISTYCGDSWAGPPDADFTTAPRTNLPPRKGRRGEGFVDAQVYTQSGWGFKVTFFTRTHIHGYGIWKSWVWGGAFGRGGGSSRAGNWEVSGA